MLMHEWLKYRDQQVRKGEAQPQEAAEGQAQPQPEGEAVAAEDQEEYLAAQRIAAEVGARVDEAQSTRLRALLSRQQRLPLEVQLSEERPTDAQPRAKESREQLIQRLLDPTLTLSETAALLGVCSATVRRYTKRGVLNCFRTPGNQRRFSLSDVLDFMEQQQKQG